MPTVAEQLRQAREAMKLDIQQVAESTKLKADQIRALEEGNHDYFSAAVYLRGSLRTYARLLKLDGPKLVAQLDSELGASVKFADDLPAPARKKGSLDSLMLLLSRLNWVVATVIILLILIALGASAGWRAWKNRTTTEPIGRLQSEMYHPSAQSGEMLPLPTSVPTNSRLLTPSTR